jgi:hypothetical protein
MPVLAASWQFRIGAGTVMEALRTPDGAGRHVRHAARIVRTA